MNVVGHMEWVISEAVLFLSIFSQVNSQWYCRVIPTNHRKGEGQQPAEKGKKKLREILVMYEVLRLINPNP